MTNKNLEKTLKWIFIAISLILVVVIVILSSTDITKKDKTKDDKVVEEEDEVSKYVEHKSYDENFTLKAPKSWKEVEKYSLNKKGLIELNEKETNSYVLVVMNSKKALNENFTAFRKRVFTQKEEYYKVKINEQIQTTIDGHDAYYAEIFFTNPTNIKIYIRSYAIETKNYYGQIVIWTTADNEEKLTKTFDNIISTFKEEE